MDAFDQLKQIFTDMFGDDVEVEYRIADAKDRAKHEGKTGCCCDKKEDSPWERFAKIDGKYYKPYDAESAEELLGKKVYDDENKRKFIITAVSENAVLLGNEGYSFKRLLNGRFYTLDDKGKKLPLGIQVKITENK